MARGTLSSTAPLKTQAYEAVNNLAEHGILAVRRKKNGEIRQVKTAVFGWLTAEQYGTLQGLKGLEPLIAEVIKGGYMLKAALWTVSVPIEVLASGTAVSLGALLVVSAVGLAIADQLAGQSFYAALDLLALALPFGELYLAWRLQGILIPGAKAAALNPQLQDTLIALTGGPGLAYELGQVLGTAAGSASVTTGAGLDSAWNAFWSDLFGAK